MWIVDVYSPKDGLSDITCFCDTIEEAEVEFRKYAKNRLLKKEAEQGASPKNYGHNTWNEVVDEFWENGEWKGVLSLTQISRDNFADEFIKRENGLVGCRS